MIFGAVDPLRSRARFKSRSIEIVTVLVVTFLALVSLASWVSANVFSSIAMMLVGDALAFGICAYLYLQWHKRPLAIRCEHCRKVVLSDTPWVCGECGNENLDTQNHSLLQECAQCHAAPKGYKCHHPTPEAVRPSEHLIFFSEDKDKRNVAKRLATEASRTKLRARSVSKLTENHADKKHQIDMVRMELIEARLNESLEALKKRMADESGNIDMESQRKSLQRHMNKWTGVDKLAKEQKQQNAKDFPNDPDAREQSDSVVDDWVFRLKSEGK